MRRSRVLSFVALAFSGVVATVVGVWFLLHPLVLSTYGRAHKSDVPPLIDGSLLLWPLLLIVLGLRRVLFDAVLDAQVRRSRRRREGEPRG